MLPGANVGGILSLPLTLLSSQAPHMTAAQHKTDIESTVSRRHIDDYREGDMQSIREDTRYDDDMFVNGGGDGNWGIDSETQRQFVTQLIDSMANSSSVSASMKNSEDDCVSSSSSTSRTGCTDVYTTTAHSPSSTTTSEHKIVDVMDLVNSFLNK